MKRIYVLFTALCVCCALAAQDIKELLILHTNDTHSRVEPIPITDPNPEFAGKAGFVRRVTLIKEIRKQDKDLLLFDCGDFSQGSPFYNMFGGEVEVKLMNEMGYDAGIIGNHEFDLGLDNMARLFKMADFPVVCANYGVQGTVLEGLVKPYVILERKGSLYGVYTNSLMVAIVTALVGTLMAYGAALVTARSSVSQKLKGTIDSIALVTNTIPGMVIGLAYLFCFSGTSLQNTFAILIICNMVHFFSTPYLMMKNSLSKMNASWETTAMLMGDNWTKTIIRVVTPNAVSTLLEVFSYYFVNAMVTISALIFLAGTRTMVITTKIKELQYFNKFLSGTSQLLFPGNV